MTMEARAHKLFARILEQLIQAAEKNATKAPQ